MVSLASRDTLLVLLDAKRGDIGETARGYAEAYLSASAVVRTVTKSSGSATRARLVPVLFMNDLLSMSYGVYAEAEVVHLFLAPSH